MGNQFKGASVLVNGKKVNKSKNVRLSVLHQNIQSINNKIVEVDFVLKDGLRSIDILCITECWVKGDYLELIQID